MSDPITKPKIGGSGWLCICDGEINNVEDTEYEAEKWCRFDRRRFKKAYGLDFDCYHVAPATITVTGEPRRVEG